MCFLSGVLAVCEVFFGFLRCFFVVCLFLCGVGLLFCAVWCFVFFFELVFVIFF